MMNEHEYDTEYEHEYDTEHMNNVVCKRNSYIQTKHQVNFHNFMSVNCNMLQEG